MDTFFDFNEKNLKIIFYSALLNSEKYPTTSPLVCSWLKNSQLSKGFQVALPTTIPPSPQFQSRRTRTTSDGRMDDGEGVLEVVAGLSPASFVLDY